MIKYRCDRQIAWYTNFLLDKLPRTKSLVVVLDDGRRDEQSISTCDTRTLSSKGASFEHRKTKE